MMTLSIIAGTLAGLITFGVQLTFVSPLIASAEALQIGSAGHQDHGARPEWEPANGLERRLYTLAGTVFTGIGFGALLLGIASLLQIHLGTKRGLLLGAAGFLCVGLAPAIGMPPRPPGVPGADVGQAQLWWTATAALTAVALWLIASSRGSWPRRISGVIVILLPHVAGAPLAESSTVVPAALSQRFAVTSVATQAIFWLSLGTLCGWLTERDLAVPVAAES